MLNQLKGGESVPKFDQSAFQELGRYNWPGILESLETLLREQQSFWRSRNNWQNVQENLLRLKVPDPQVEKDEDLGGYITIIF